MSAADKSENRTRHILKRTKAKHKIHPTPGREMAIERYERFLRHRELLRMVELNPDMRMTVREILWYLS